MKAMLTAFSAIAVITVGSYFTLMQMGFSAQDRTSGASVRID